MRTLAMMLAFIALPASAVTCEDIEFEGLSFTICTVDAGTENLALHHRKAAGEVLGSFDALAEHVAPKTLTFAMNAGMYHEDLRAVGLYIQGGAETAGLVKRAGPGNFGLLPNGLLCINDNSAQVIESLSYADSQPACRDATQSGPMLVIDGVLHPRLLPDGTSMLIRNGVGTSADGQRAVFAISNDSVNFHTFARLFRDVLDVLNALYLDGNVSRLYAVDLEREDVGFSPLGPIVAVVE
jgi:uncharacterized protein YigE (DUF2233 family)